MTSRNRGDQPIGVLGSGLGGLSVVRSLRRMLAGETIVYLGDTAHGSYGDKSAETIERLALRAGAALFQHAPKLLVIASNSVSAHGLAALQAMAPCPVIGVIESGAEAAAAASGPVGVIGTLATIQSGAYEEAILRRNPKAVIHSLACPLLENLAEQGWSSDPITDSICRRYLNALPYEVHTLVMGCTHYPILLPSLVRTRPETRWLDSCELTARAVERLLGGGLGFRTASARGALQVFLTDRTVPFKAAGEQLLGESLERVEQTDLPNRP